MMRIHNEKSSFYYLCSYCVDLQINLTGIFRLFWHCRGIVTFTEPD